MPVDGQAGVAPDGTPVVWSERLGRAVPAGTAKAFGVSGFGKGGAGPSKSDQDRVNAMLASREQVKNLAGLVNDFAIRNDRTKTGGALAVPGVPAYVQAQGLKGSDDLGVMDSDALQAATMMRAPGMRLTQMEFQKFLGGVPSIKKDIVANRPFQSKTNNAMVNAAAQAAFYDRWLRNRKSLDGADEAWNAWSGQHFDPLGNYSADPKSQANSVLKAKSAGAAASKGPVLLGYE